MNLTMEDLKNYLRPFCVVKLFINGELMFDDMDDGFLSNPQFYFDAFINNSNKRVKSINLEVVHFHHTIARIEVE